ncbi:MAG: hypothetical protein LCH80_02605 [Proteobacteria bacterium]|nr:hypothetical protein [Pseudomonadota bacterium]
MPGFVARCIDGIVTPGNGKPLRLWLGHDGHGPRVQVQVDGANEQCLVEDPGPLAAALAELTGSSSPPSQPLVDADGWLRRAFRTDGDASRDVFASELALIRERPLDASSLHH